MIKPSVTSRLKPPQNEEKLLIHPRQTPAKNFTFFMGLADKIYSSGIEKPNGGKCCAVSPY
jgi:hypothetical protein